MPMIRTLALAAVFAAAPLSAALAQTEVCKAPGALPSRPALGAPAKPALPVKPACVTGNKCSEKEGNRYNEEIGKYNAALGAHDAERGKQVELANAYFKSLNGYASEFEAFMVCERKNAIVAINGPQ